MEEKREKMDGPNTHEETKAGAESKASGKDSDDGKSGGESLSHKKVEIGTANASSYTFATHGPPPESPEEEQDESGCMISRGVNSLFDGEKFSVAFVLGIIIVAAVLFIGLMFASHQRQLQDLSSRIEAVEQAVELQADSE